MRALIAGLFVFLAPYSVAQTGPGGVGSADGTSTLKLWFRPDNGVNATGSSVDSWTNSAGIAALDISETGTQRPTRVTGAVNGFSEISFSGTNRLRTGLTLTTSNFVNDEASSFVVARADNTTQTSSLYLTDPLEANRFSTHIPWSATVYFDIGTCCGNDARLNVGGLTGLTAYSVWSYDANPASGKQLYRNGTLLLNRALTSTYSSHATHRFNIGGNTSGTNGFAGDVTEVIIFNIRINSAQRILIQNYLAAKYGLTLATDDFYTMDDAGNGNFDHDVAGIGRVNATNIHNDARGTGIVRIFNPTGLADGEFFMWGHDNGSLTVNTTDVPAGVQGRLSRVWRVSEPTNVGNLDMQFDLTGLGTITASDLRLLIDDDGDGIFNEVGTIQTSGATSLGANNYLFTAVAGANITTGDRFTIGTINLTQTPLPIELESFTGKIVEGDAHLKWKTLTEINDHFFTIERSLNGKDFFSVGEVPGSGTSKTPITYQYKDLFPPYGRLYYRLKQTDFDEAHSNSGIIMLDNKVEDTQLMAVPNPVQSGQAVNLRIRHPEQVDSKNVVVTVHDQLGRRISIFIETDEQNQLLFRFNNKEASGIYTVIVRSPQLSGPLFTRIQLIK